MLSYLTCKERMRLLRVCQALNKNPINHVLKHLRDQLHLRSYNYEKLVKSINFINNAYPYPIIHQTFVELYSLSGKAFSKANCFKLYLVIRELNMSIQPIYIKFMLPKFNTYEHIEPYINFIMQIPVEERYPYQSIDWFKNIKYRDNPPSYILPKEDWLAERFIRHGLSRCIMNIKDFSPIIKFSYCIANNCEMFNFTSTELDSIEENIEQFCAPKYLIKCYLKRYYGNNRLSEILRSINLYE